MIVVLTGGTGGAKFVDGLYRTVPPNELKIIVNTGDDFAWWGLHISPDIDSIVYVLADLLSKDRGWGVQDDTFECLGAMRRLGQPAWFQIGDRDLAMHLTRTRLMREGKTLSQGTQEITRELKLHAEVLPMTNARVETRVTIPQGEISFQEYFVQRRFRDEVKSVRFEGSENSQPAPGVIDAIMSADAIIFAPSNPVTSIGPILAVPGIRAALRATKASITAISPIVGGAAVSGPAGGLMTSQGLEVSIAGVANAYEDFLDALIVDRQDESAAEQLQSDTLKVHCTSTIMKTPEDRITLANETLKFAKQTFEVLTTNH